MQLLLLVMMRRRMMLLLMPLWPRIAVRRNLTRRLRTNVGSRILLYISGTYWSRAGVATCMMIVRRRRVKITSTTLIMIASSPAASPASRRLVPTILMLLILRIASWRTGMMRRRRRWWRVVVLIGSHLACLLGVDQTFSLKGVTIQADNEMSVMPNGQEENLPSYCKDMMPMTKGKARSEQSQEGCLEALW
jgi:hypothetical protein